MVEGTAATITMARRRGDGRLIVFEEREPTAERGGYRAYHLQEQDGARERYPSVTTIRDRIRPKGWLRDWAEGRGVVGGVLAERAGVLRGVEPEAAVDVVREQGWSEASSGVAMERGKLVHSLLEAYARDGAVPNPADHPVEARGHIRAIVRWLLDADPVPYKDAEGIAIERLIAHRGLRYAGRYDLRAYVRGVDCIVDLKTRPRARVYLDDLLQLTGYALGEEDCGAVAPTRLIAVSTAPDGTYGEWPVAPDYLAEAWVKGLDYHNTLQPLESAFLSRRRREEEAA